MVVCNLRTQGEIQTLRVFDIVQLNCKTYYYHIKHFEKTDKYAAVKDRIAEIYNANKSRYGYRRIVSELRKESKIINGKVLKSDKFISKKACLTFWSRSLLIAFL
jgi:hypothetical protein